MSDNAKPSAAPAADNGMTSFPIYAVTVERSNNEKVVAEVPEYEIPVLQALHGEFNVTKGEHIFDDERPSEAAAILEALKRKYNNKNTGDVVSVVYRNADELAKAAGISVGKATRPAESLQIDGRKKSAAK